MADLEKISHVVREFLKKSLKVKEVKVIKVAKAGSSWETQAEVFEESSFIKSLGLPTRVQDYNVYDVILDENLEVLSYERERMRSHA